VKEFTPINIRKPFKILSLDGGGVRAILQSVILSRLVEIYPNLIKEVDMFAGASAGGILSLSLAAGLNPIQTTELWEEIVPVVFTEGFFRKLASLDNTIRSVYSPDKLEAAIRAKVGDITLAELKQKVFVPTLRLDVDPIHSGPGKVPRWHPHFFHNFPYSKTIDTKIVDVAMRTSAAPTFFPIREGYVDGGCFANHPTMACVAEAVRSGVNYDDIVVLSISTGNIAKVISSDTYGTGDWGLIQWAPHVVDMLLDSNSLCVDYECRHLLGDRYFRIDPLLSRPFGLDEASALPELKQLASTFDLTSCEQWLQKMWKPIEALEPNGKEADPLNKPTGNQSSYCNIQ